MRWRRFTVPALGLVLAGCGADSSYVSAELPVMSARAALQPDPSVARAQKAEQELPPHPSQTVMPVAHSVPAGPQDTRVAVRVAALVNGVPILHDEVREATYRYLLQTQSLPEPERSRVQKQIYEQELNKIIDREVVLTEALARIKELKPQILEKLQEAARKQFDQTVRNMKEQAAKQGFVIKSDEDLKAALQAQGLSLEGIRRQIERSFIQTEYMRSRIGPVLERIGHQDIVDYYNAHPSEFEVEDRVVWHDIFIDAYRYPDRNAARQAAESILARARNGEDFMALLEKYNNGDSVYRKGEGYGQRRGEIKPPEAESILFGLKVGEVGPLIEMTNGYHIVRVSERDHAGIRPLDEKTQTAIRKKLQNMLGQREFDRILAELRRKATIEIAPYEP